MAQVKGWTRMDSDSWRHDGSPQGLNKLNILIKDESQYKDIGDHVADVNPSQSDTYLLVYTVNNSPSDYDSGSHVLGEFTSLRDARREATKVREDNPDTIPL